MLLHIVFCQSIGYSGFWSFYAYTRMADPIFTFNQVILIWHGCVWFESSFCSNIRNIFICMYCPLSPWLSFEVNTPSTNHWKWNIQFQKNQSESNIHEIYIIFVLKKLSNLRNKMCEIWWMQSPCGNYMFQSHLHLYISWDWVFFQSPSQYEYVNKT